MKNQETISRGIFPLANLTINDVHLHTCVSRWVWWMADIFSSIGRKYRMNFETTCYFFRVIRGQCHRVPIILRPIISIVINGLTIFKNIIYLNDYIAIGVKIFILCGAQWLQKHLPYCFSSIWWTEDHTDRTDTHNQSASRCMLDLVSFPHQYTHLCLQV